MPTFADVVQAWRDADPKHINPMREHVSEEAYWESGRAQSEFVYDLVGPDATVLDFGCGDGRIAIPMAKLGLQVHAVDAAPEMIERLRHQGQAHDVDSGMIRAHVWDGTTPLDGFVPQFDAINARAVFIHHSHADVALMVRNLASALEPGGFFIADWPLGPHHERRDWIDVTTWESAHRQAVAESAGLRLQSEGDPGTRRPSVWVKQ